MVENVGWDTEHSSAVAGVTFAGLVYALIRLHQQNSDPAWEAELFDQISRHFDNTMSIPIRGDGDRDALKPQGSSEAMREAHRVLGEAFALARQTSAPR